jgi:ferredoxin
MRKSKKNCLREGNIMEGISRKNFFGIMGAMGAFSAMGAASIAPSPVEVVFADEADDSGQDNTETPSDEELVATERSGYNRDDLLKMLLDEPEVTEDLEYDDGTVIPAVYVALRNRLNRIGDGVGNDPQPAAFQAVMALWSEEDAAHELEMPFLEVFNAADYAHKSGRSEEECAEILHDLASRKLIVEWVRGDVPFYFVMPWVDGIWEYHVQEYSKEFLSLGMNSSDKAATSSPYPLLRSTPVSADVVEGGFIDPYDDHEAMIKRNSVIAIAPCQCRQSKEIMGTRACDDDTHPRRTCLALGEMGEYFIEYGVGEQITQEEALEVYRDAVDRGMVPETYYDRGGSLMCCCHSDCCAVLGRHRAVNGEYDVMEFVSNYQLNYDKDKCIQCGACIQRCPMSSITFGEDGYCVMDKACVACGQCVLICPASARILTRKENTHEFPIDMVDDYIWRAEDRMAKGYIKDCLGGHAAIVEE